MNFSPFAGDAVLQIVAAALCCFACFAAVWRAGWARITVTLAWHAVCWLYASPSIPWRKEGLFLSFPLLPLPLYFPARACIFQKAGEACHSPRPPVTPVLLGEGRGGVACMAMFARRGAAASGVPGCSPLFLLTCCLCPQATAWEAGMPPPSEGMTYLGMALGWTGRCRTLCLP